MSGARYNGWRWSIAGAIALGLVLYSSDRVTLPHKDEGPWARPRVDRDLAAIAKDTLRVGLVALPLVFEERPGARSGLELELLERFASDKGLALKVVVLPSVDSLLPALQRGGVDVAGGLLSPFSAMAPYVDLTRPYRSTHPVGVSLRSDAHAGASGRAEHPEDTLWLPRSHPFGPRPYTWHPTPDTLLQGVDSLDMHDLLVALVVGGVGGAVLPDVLVRAVADRYPVLRCGGPLGPSVPLSFAVRRNAPGLRKALDGWLKDPATEGIRSALLNASSGPLPTRATLGKRTTHSPLEGRISPFDTVFQQHDTLMPWDWELLAAVAFKESRFDTTARSRRGAVGLMQMLPRTASAFGADSSSRVEDQVQAAARFLVRLDSIWMRSVRDPDQRLCFVLASYNAGPGHVHDARLLARELGLDPTRWEGNVERALLLLSDPAFFTRDDMRAGYVRGSETFRYVRDVLGMYRRFRKVRTPG